MNKTAIKNFAVEARKKLIASVIDKAGLLGITKDEIKKPEANGDGFEVYKTHAGTENTIYNEQIKYRASLVNKINEKGFQNIVEEVAYTWFNRIIAVRFMEVNDYLPSRVRVLSSETDGKNEPDIVTLAPKIDLEFKDNEIETIIKLKEENKLDELFQMLFIKQCNELGQILPELFEKTSDYTEMLLNISYINEDGVIRDLMNIEEDDFLEAVEIIGWMYQYYNDERKNEVININKRIVKKDDIPAATQLFTTDWVVRYMVDNSLGKYWIERNPASNLKEKLEFYLESEEGNITYIDERISPTDLKFIDPCMGSGHILVYAFDVLIEIYKECGYSEKDASKLIVTNNIFGTDIDDRAYQLSYFAVMMKARSYNRRILGEGISPNLCSMQDSENLVSFEHGNEQLKLDDMATETANYLISIFKNAKEIGSIQVVENRDYDELENYIGNLKQNGADDLFIMQWLNEISVIMPRLITQAKILSQKYDVVATNPPYLNKMDAPLKKYVIETYKDYSADLFSVFIYRNFGLCKENGYSAFMTPFVWMFIKTYEKLREYIINQKSISSLIQMEYSAFEEAIVPICSFVLKNSRENSKGDYIKLSDFKGGMEIQKQKVLEAIATKNCSYLFSANAENFAKIPGMPVAYWVSDKTLEIFNCSMTINDVAIPRKGLVTMDNNRFLRMWYEVNYCLFYFNAKCSEDCISNKAKWVPHSKGGSFRKWYGNRDYIINWYNNGRELKNSVIEKYNGGSYTKEIRSESYYFKPMLCWSGVSSGSISFRLNDKGFTFDTSGPAAFPNDDNYKEVLGFLNCKVVMQILKFISPTISFLSGDIALLPVIDKMFSYGKINELVSQNISISKTDWDSFEISWDFLIHPLVRLCHGLTDKNENEIAHIEDAFTEWEFDTNKNFNQLKSNEEELNRIFIEIYGLQDELTPDVEDKDVTIRKADLVRDIKSFISYAVGCMFGRYSLDVDGLAYAGGEFDNNKYETFIPDMDNVIPITDEEYFEDDIVGRFVEFVKVVYGAETLEENLDFIAQALGNKGDSTRECIRNYFIKDFYKDHIKTYQKRPIYWQFDSGKENGFKALIYMHRYDEDTVGRVRTDYLHKAQNAIENAIRLADYTIDSTASAIEKAKAVKKKEKLVKQLSETKQYDQAIAHIAHQRIAIDLDDGVTVNYARFQAIEVANEGKKAVKIDLLGKI